MRLAIAIACRRPCRGSARRRKSNPRARRNGDRTAPARRASARARAPSASSASRLDQHILELACRKRRRSCAARRRSCRECRRGIRARDAGLARGQRDVEIERAGAGGDVVALGRRSRRSRGPAAPPRRRCRRRAPADSRRRRSPSPARPRASRRGTRRGRRRSAGRNITSAGPPTRNQVSGASGASAVRRPRTGGRRSMQTVARRCAPPSCRAPRRCAASRARRARPARPAPNW